MRDEILKDANPVAIFFEDCVQVRKGAQTKKRDVYASFENWAYKKRISVGGVVSRQKFYVEFGRILESEGLSNKPVTVKGTQYFKDISLENL